MKKKNNNPESWQDRVITKSRGIEQAAIKRIVTAGAKSPEEGEVLYAAWQAEERAERLARKSGATFVVGSEPGEAAQAAAPTTPPDNSETVSPTGEAAALEASVPVMPPPIAQEGNVPIRVQVEPKDGRFDPKWKEATVNSGDIPTGVPQPEFASQTIIPEQEVSLPERGGETEKMLSVTTEDIARLMGAVEETRTFYAEALAIDRREQSLFSKVTALLKNVKRVPDPAITRAESVYREQLMLLQNVELERIKQSGLSGQELKNALAEGLRYFKVNEAQELYEAQTKMQLQAMEQTKMGRLSQKIENFFRAYNKLSLKKKLGVAGGWAALAVATGGTSVVASRAFASMSLATGLNATGDAWVQKKRTNVLEKELEGTLERPILNLGETHPDDNMDEEHIDASMRDLERADAMGEVGDQTKDREIRLMRIPKNERTPEEQEWLDHQEAELRLRAGKAQELSPEELYERFTTFAQKTITENTDLIEKWIINDKRRRWGVRVAAVATVVIAGKLAGEFMQSDTGKSLSQTIRAKMTAGISHLSEYFGKDMGTLKEYGKKAAVYFSEAAQKNVAAEMALGGDESLLGVEAANKTTGGAVGGGVVSEGQPRGTADSLQANLGGGSEDRIAAEISKEKTPKTSLLNGFQVDPASSKLAQEILNPLERTPTLDEITNVRPTLAEKFQVDPASSKLVQEMLNPLERTPTLDEIRELETAGATKPEGILSKIESILTHSATKGDTLWGDSIKLAKELGIDASKQNAFAAKVEAVLREAIEQNPKLLEKMGFSEAEFTQSHGERLWLVEGKLVDYREVLSDEKLQEVMKSMTAEGDSLSAQNSAPPVSKPVVSVKPLIPDLSSSGAVQAEPSNEFQAMTQNTGSADLATSVVAREMSTSVNPKGQILTIRNVAGGAELPSDVAKLKASLLAENTTNLPADGSPKIGAEAILGAKGSGTTGGGARFMDAAIENSGSKKPSAGLVKAAAETLSSETLLKEYGPDVFQSQRYISSLPRTQQASFFRELTRVAQEHFSLLNTNVSESDKIQSLRFTQFANMRLTEFLSGYGELEPRDVVGGKASDAIMPDVLKQADDLRKNNLIFFQDLHPEQTRRVGEFVDWCKSRFGAVALPGKKETVAEYMARMVIVSQKTGISIHRVRL